MSEKPWTFTGCLSGPFGTVFWGLLCATADTVEDAVLNRVFVQQVNSYPGEIVPEIQQEDIGLIICMEQCPELVVPVLMEYAAIILRRSPRKSGVHLRSSRLRSKMSMSRLKYLQATLPSFGGWHRNNHHLGRKRVYLEMFSSKHNAQFLQCSFGRSHKQMPRQETIMSLS